MRRVERSRSLEFEQDTILHKHIRGKDSNPPSTKEDWDFYLP